MEKRTRLDRLIAVFDRFHESLNDAPGERAAEWVGHWRELRPNYLNPPLGVRKGELSGGLVQGLLEMPLSFADLPTSERRFFSNAYNAAIEAEYPEILQSQQARLGRIVTRGRISSESQFHLVRHAIDILEGDSARADELAELYRLIDLFEARGR